MEVCQAILPVLHQLISIILYGPNIPEVIIFQTQPTKSLSQFILYNSKKECPIQKLLGFFYQEKKENNQHL